MNLFKKSIFPTPLPDVQLQTITDSRNFTVFFFLRIWPNISRETIFRHIGLFFSLSFIFIPRSTGTANFSRWLILFLLMIVRYQARIKWSVSNSKSERILWVTFFRTGSILYIHHLLLWSNFNRLQNFQWIVFSTKSCRVFYSS